MFLMKSYKFKLCPNKTQSNTFNKWVNTCRAVYNLCLEQKQYAFKAHGVSISKFESYNQLPPLKKEFPWVGEVHSDVLRQTVDRVYLAYDKFFSGGGYPKWAKKDTYCSFTYKRFVKVEGDFVKLPKIGKVKFRKSREIVGEIRTATIKRELKGYFIHIVARQELPEIKPADTLTGIDLGVAKFATFSTGEVVEKPHHLNLVSKEIRRLQRKISRQKKGSNSRKKTIHTLRKVYNKLTHSRKDFLHKQSTKAVSKHDGLVVEDLKISKMLGKDSQLSKNLLDNGLSEFIYMLEYKSAFSGKPFHKISPAYTSQKCSSCGHVSKENRKTQSDFVCVNCGFTENADFNAALNIQALGKSFSAKAEPLG